MWRYRGTVEQSLDACVGMSVYMHVYACVYVYECVCVVCMCLREYVRLCVCVFVCDYMYGVNAYA